MTNTKPKLTRTMQGLINDFDESAQYHGWQKDQGTGNDVDIAAKGYAESKAALEKGVLRLQQQIRTLKEENRQLKGRRIHTTPRGTSYIE